MHRQLAYDATEHGSPVRHVTIRTRQNRGLCAPAHPASLDVKSIGNLVFPGLLMELRPELGRIFEQSWLQSHRFHSRRDANGTVVLSFTLRSNTAPGDAPHDDLRVKLVGRPRIGNPQDIQIDTWTVQANDALGILDSALAKGRPGTGSGASDPPGPLTAQTAQDRIEAAGWCCTPWKMGTNDIENLALCLDVLARSFRRVVLFSRDARGEPQIAALLSVGTPADPQSEWYDAGDPYGLVLTPQQAAAHIRNPRDLHVFAFDPQEPPDRA